MRCIQPACFTRVVVDGVDDLEVADLPAIERRIRQCLPHIPDAQRHYIGKALLDLAFARMLTAPAANERDSNNSPDAPSRIAHRVNLSLQALRQCIGYIDR